MAELIRSLSIVADSQVITGFSESTWEIRPLFVEKYMVNSGEDVEGVDSLKLSFSLTGMTASAQRRGPKSQSPQDRGTAALLSERGHRRGEVSLQGLLLKETHSSCNSFCFLPIATSQTAP